MKKHLNKEPGYQNDGVVVFSFEKIEYVFDQGETNTSVAITLASNNCECDFKNLSMQAWKLKGTKPEWLKVISSFED